LLFLLAAGRHFIQGLKYAGQECPSARLGFPPVVWLENATDMMTTGEDYLDELAGFPPKTFPRHFSRRAIRLRLGTALDGTELKWLYEAAFGATLCNIALNGLGGCGGEIKPEREPNRRRLEGEFMAARDKFYACAGWQVVSPFLRHPVQSTFLRISVDEVNLAV
jgi:hypothetical protein